MCRLSANAVLPTRGSAGAAGYDLSSAASAVIPARSGCSIPTDLAIGVPLGTYGRIAPRSGLAFKSCIDVLAGVVDSDYTGHVQVMLFNHNDCDFKINIGDRIAQLIIERISTPDIEEVNDLNETVRGSDGFGSTGVNMELKSVSRGSQTILNWYQC